MRAAQLLADYPRYMWPRKSSTISFKSHITQYPLVFVNSEVPMLAGT